MRFAYRSFFVAMLALLGTTSSVANAQGLIWKLPEKDGVQVRYGGVYTHTTFDPVTNVQKDKTAWDRTLTISSVGRESGDSGAARWIEFKVEMRKKDDVGAELGPVAVRIYKVLIDEKEELGRTPTADDPLPVTFIRIKKGYRKLSDADPEPITSGVLQVFPTVSLLRHFREFKSGSGTPDDPQLANHPDLKAAKWSGTFSMESLRSQSVNSADIWSSKDVPFGLARWDVNIVRKSKRATAPRDDFVKVTEIVLNMEFKEAVEGAKSELPVK
ncbi:MAG: hypothetical protein CMJ48_04650 [Planctomycetaceae bacterium]|nr:hypothetical protein [Planctomycetaceae bacterium]